MAHHEDIDWDAIRARVANAQGDTEPTKAEPEHESMEDLTRRISGADLNDIALRMFRN